MPVNTVKPLSKTLPKLGFFVPFLVPHYTTIQRLDNNLKIAA